MDFRKKSNSMGKYYRKQKNLRKKDEKAQLLEPSAEFTNYVNDLKNQGLECKKLQLGKFYTKNGLPYSGFLTTDQIVSNEDIIRVPMKCLLTTKVCFFSEINKVFRQNPGYFSLNGTSSWEDHIFIFFLVFENQKQKQSKWYGLLSNLSRDIDYVIFWNDDELDMLNDPTLVKQARQKRNEFEIEFKQAQKIAKKYPQFFKENSMTHDNFKWIYTHMVTRCFGKYLQYVTMVPFVEMLNHECSDVFYDFDYNSDNKFIPEDFERQAPKELTEKGKLIVYSTDFFHDVVKNYKQLIILQT